MDLSFAYRLIFRSASNGLKIASFHTNRNFSKSRLILKFFVTSSAIPAGYFILRSSGLKALPKTEEVNAFNFYK